MPTIRDVKINGKKLKKLRESRLLTREELAEKIASHRDHIGRLERGNIAEPRMKTIKSLAAALEVDPSEFLED